MDETLNQRLDRLFAKPEEAVTMQEVVELCHLIAKHKGWWDRPRNEGEMIALIHSELSEMLEALRVGDWKEDVPMSSKLPGITAEAEEAADVLIRLFDYCGGRWVPIVRATVMKMAYNTNRPYRHGKAF